jgi:hypothetical protein
VFIRPLGNRSFETGVLKGRKRIKLAVFNYRSAEVKFLTTLYQITGNKNESFFNQQ